MREEELNAVQADRELGHRRTRISAPCEVRPPRHLWLPAEARVMAFLFSMLISLGNCGEL